MSEPAPPAAPTPNSASASCGTQLRAARVAAGLSIEAVAQQLKLAPRQVAALEEEKFDLLPERTFIRGFLRNYARLLHLDPETVLAGLPEASVASALAPTPPSMGEIRAEGGSRRSWSRWAIPIALAGLIALVALYEYIRPGSVGRVAEEHAGNVARAPASAAPAVPAPALSGASDAGAGSAGTPLPNPLERGSGVAALPRDGDAAPAVAPGATSAAAGPAQTTGPAIANPPVPTGAQGGSATAATTGEPILVIVYRGAAWTEVKDGAGKTVLSLTGTPGTTQSVTASPPLDVVIGNASEVSVTFRGAAVDLTPYLRQNIAKLKLP